MRPTIRIIKKIIVFESIDFNSGFSGFLFFFLLVVPSITPIRLPSLDNMMPEFYDDINSVFPGIFTQVRQADG